MERFKVNEREIPSQITINLGAMERCLFARMLTDYGIPVEYAGDNFVHIFKKGLKKVYNEEYPNDKVY
jgi:hypothetical protein